MHIASAMNIGKNEYIGFHDENKNAIKTKKIIKKYNQEE